MKKKNFSLIEVMASIVILAILLTIVFYGYVRIKFYLGNTQCQAKMTRVFTGIRRYTRDNNGYLSLYYTGARWNTGSYESSRGYRWGSIETESAYYWGVPYAEYMNSSNYLNAREFFRCPNVERLYFDRILRGTSLTQQIIDEEIAFTSYGINHYYDGTGNSAPQSLYWHFSGGGRYGNFSPRKLKEVSNLSSIILLQDSYIQAINNPQYTMGSLYIQDNMYRHDEKMVRMMGDGSTSIHSFKQLTIDEIRDLYLGSTRPISGAPPGGPPPNVNKK